MAGYILGGVAFKTKAAIKEYAQQYLNKQYSGKFIDDAVILDLVRFHPDYAEMSGDELCKVRVASPPKFKTFCFWVVRPNGESDSAGLKYMLQGLNSKPAAIRVNAVLADLRNAMRQAVQPQIDEVRRTWEGKGPCEVDHVFPRTFSTLLLQWLQQMEIDGSTVSVERVGPATFRLLERSMEDSWVAFHRENAVLEAIPKEEHAVRTKLHR